MSTPIVRRTVLVCAASVCLASPGTGSRAQEPSGGEPQVAVILAARATYWNGRAGWAATGDALLRPGETKTAYVWAGRPPESGICSGGAADAVGREDDSMKSRGAHVWAMRATLVSARIDEIVMDVEWQHFTTGPDGVTRATGRGERHLVVSEQQPVALDFLRGAETDTDCRVASLEISASASIQEPAALAQREIRYEMWLDHTMPDGERLTEFVSQQARQGESMAFRFPRQTWPLRDSELEILMTVSGTVRGRLRPDGTVDLSVRAGRSISQSPTALRAIPPGRSGDERGFKRLSVAEGEPVRIELPTPRGFSATVRAGALSPTHWAATMRGGRIGVDYQKAFEGHATAIVIRATRAGSEKP